ncbi:dihydrodipicolinate synthase family protein [Actinokineospora auranticolor]|uniref:4-hydroxy-tetrahydrodipicolinate synthase n=1 Tax=Actinokineospora auranticolor TaxID=155976 RepID=A0A2S6H0E5_9PSEU|nr:dihydrodipicolinate synthase family protein [Actinokineospora auranticolor]PPK70955.1 4-hydroxy-tetrahydrodipicolinate synthase [Actinokineospora auranticolor]
MSLLVPLITPFTADDRVDTAALARLAREVLDDGADGLVALGTTAEAATLTPDERAAVLEVCAAAGAPLVVGVGSSDTAATARALEALPAGVTGALVPVPPFTRPSPDGVVAHFAAIAGLVPLIVYNVPQRTGTVLSVETLARLAAIPGVVGLKHAVPVLDADAVAFLADREDFAVYAGDDVLAPALLALGADGGILASAHVHTRRWADLVGAWRSGHQARALGHRLSRLAAALFAEPNPAVIKAVLHAEGRIATPAVRLPLLPSSSEALARVTAETALPWPREGLTALRAG